MILDERHGKGWSRQDLWCEDRNRMADVFVRGIHLRKRGPKKDRKPVVGSIQAKKKGGPRGWETIIG